MAVPEPEVLTSLVCLNRTISDIDEHEWNRLAAQNAFATHRWLRTVETSCRAPLQALYFTLRRDETLIAAAVCYVCPVTREIETLDDLFFGRLVRAARLLGLSFLPAVVCGPLLGYGWHIGVRPGAGEAAADEARRRILDAMESEADARGLRLTFAHLLDDEGELTGLLTKRGYLRCRNAPVAVLDVKWRSFDEYTADLPPRRRREFKRQTNRNRDAGNVIARVESTRGVEGRLLDLIDDNALKHNARPFPCGLGFFEALEAGLGEHARIFAARKAGAITAVTVMLVQCDAAFPVAVGVDYRVASDDYSYFQLTYNTLIAHAIESGIRRVYYGRGLYDVKVRRGCWLTDSWIYTRSSGSHRLASAAWFAVVSFWNRQKLSSEVRKSLIG